VSPRAATWAPALLLLALASASCRTRPGSSEPPLRPSNATNDGSDDDGIAPDPVRVAEPELLVSVTDLAPTFAAIEAITERWSPQGALDIPRLAETLLLAQGRSPELWKSIDPKGTHSVYMAMQSKAFAAVVAVAAPGEFAEALGARPTGPDQWDFPELPAEVVARATGPELAVGSSHAALDRAAALRRDDRGTQPIRARMGTIELRPDQDPQDFFEGPVAFDLALSLRPDADLEAMLTLDGQLTAKGQAALGPALSAPGTIERVLPAGTMAFGLFAFGNTADLHQAVDEIARASGASRLPDPTGLGEIAKSFVDLLPPEGANAALAAYPEGDNIVFAVEVADEGKAFAKLAVAAVMIAGGRPGTKLEPTEIGGRQVEQLTFGKTSGGTQRAVLFVHEGVALAVLAPTAPKLAARIIRGKGPRLADDVALADLRRKLGGCELCITVDPVAFAERRLGEAVRAGDAVARRQAKVLQQARGLGAFSVGSTKSADGRQSKVLLNVPRSLLFASPKVTRVIVETLLGAPSRPDVVAASPPTGGR
jgi:hypothetical protein